MVVNPPDLPETLGHEATLGLFYTAILAKFTFKNGLGTEYGFALGLIDDLPRTTRNLAVDLALDRAALLPSLGGHLSLVQGGGLVR